MRAFAIAAVLVVGMVLPAKAEGDEHMKLSTGLPVTIEDAGKIEKGSVDLKMRFFYERLRGSGGRNLLTFDPEVEVGVARGLSIGVSPSYAFGNADDAQQGELELEVEYNVLEPTGGGPGVTLEAMVVRPYGSGSNTLEAGLAARATQPLGSGPTAPRLHLNVAWRHLFDAEDDERDNRFIVAAGVNFAVARSTAVAFDVVREQSRTRGEVENYVEAGVRHAFDAKTALGAGIGVGLGPDSARYRLLVGVQRSF